MRSLLRYILVNAWAMEPTALTKCTQVLNRHLAGEKLNQYQVAEAIGRDPSESHPDTMAYDVRDGVAVVPVRGVLAKYSADVNGVSQPEGTSCEKIQAQLKAAAKDPAVKAIVLAIDSPGGMVAGTPETGALIAELAKRMPVAAHIEDLGASAAYWLASQATSVHANAGAQVGSIGVVTRLTDTSEMAKKQGVKVNVIRSVALKAPGQPGESITAEQLADVQRLVASSHAMFSAAVATGRRFDDAALAKVATGQLWIASEALSLGLIDSVCPLDSLISNLAGRSATPIGNTTMPPSSLLAINRSQLTARAAELRATIASAEAELASTSGTKAAPATNPFEGLVGEPLWRAMYATIPEFSDEFMSADGFVAFMRNQDKIMGNGMPPRKAAVREQSDAELRAEFAASAALQDGYMGGVESYVAGKRQEARLNKADPRRVRG